MQYFLMQPTTAEDFTCFILIVAIIRYKNKEYFAQPWYCVLHFIEENFLKEVTVF